MVLLVVYTQTEQFVIRLLQRGAIVTTAGPDGNTPLHLVALRGFVNVGRSLLDHDAKTMAKNNEKQIPLQLAIMNSRSDFAVLMIKSMEPSRSGDHRVLDSHEGNTKINDSHDFICCRVRHLFMGSLDLPCTISLHNLLVKPGMKVG